MSNITSMHHSFDIQLAAKYGIEEAILIHHFQHWVSFNKETKRNFHEDRTWTYQTLEDIAAHFPYFTKNRVFELMERLCNGKSRRSKKEDQEFEPVLIKGNFNNSKYDRTVWYAFIDEPKWILANAKMENGKCQNQDRQMPTPIPDPKPDPKHIKEGDDASSPNPSTFFTQGKVKMEKHKYKNLLKDYEHAQVHDFIETLDNYAESKPKEFKKYSCHAATIRNWMRRDGIKKKPAEIKEEDLHSNEPEMHPNQEWFEYVMKSNRRLQREGAVWFMEGGIRFTLNGQTETLIWNDENFMDKSIRYLRALGANLEENT